MLFSFLDLFSLSSRSTSPLFDSSTPWPKIRFLDCRAECLIAMNGRRHLVIYSLLIVAHESKYPIEENDKFSSSLLTALIPCCRSDGIAARTFRGAARRLRSRSWSGSFLQHSRQRHYHHWPSRRSRSTPLRNSRTQSQGGECTIMFLCLSSRRQNQKTLSGNRLVLSCPRRMERRENNR